jgi:hypothetical protein
MEWTSIGVLLVLAFGVNLPLGWQRGRQRKFSPSWFVAIHASIPFLIATRFALGVPFWVVPLEFVLILGGQVTGARLIT